MARPSEIMAELLPTPYCLLFYLIHYKPYIFISVFGVIVSFRKRLRTYAELAALVKKASGTNSNHQKNNAVQPYMLQQRQIKIKAGQSQIKARDKKGSYCSLEKLKPSREEKGLLGH